VNYLVADTVDASFLMLHCCRPWRALRAANPVRIRNSVIAGVGRTTITTIVSSPDAEASVVDRV
jgi:hypothetical protein